MRISRMTGKSTKKKKTTISNSKYFHSRTVPVKNVPIMSITDAKPSSKTLYSKIYSTVAEKRTAQ